METNSSGEELVIKARKPYTITKQREKWTEEEHNKFIEALKLYGRAWQRIEEHIGTKTAVQIRSHAQKFFTKLEKEAVMKGVPFGQVHDIKIPPPRPKRKPSSPYPRKTGVGSLSPSVEVTDEKTSESQSPLSNRKQSININDYAAWKIQEAKDNSENGSCSEVHNLFQDARAASNSSLSKGLNGFVPLEMAIRDKATLKDSSLSIGLNKDMKENGIFNANLGNKELKGAEVSKQTDKIGQSDQSCAKDTPVEFIKNSGDENINEKPSLNPTIPSTSEMNANSGVSSIHHSFQTFPPFTQFPTNQDAYRSFLNISSTFSSLIISTLLQNPAVHAAASMTASFWSSTGRDASTASSSEPVNGGMLSRHLNPNPSMTDIAAATVAAASAWWATQGLLPVYSPLHPGCAFAPAPGTAIPVVSTARKEEGSNDTIKKFIPIDGQDVDAEQSEAVRTSLSDSGESGRVELTSGKSDKFGVDADKARNMKKLDRSSCGSNTPSGSEVETDAARKKQDGDEEIEPKQVHLYVNPPSVETNTRRIRSSTGIMSESWKEVSDEGRIAFQALFNREVLPQSFSPPHAKDSILMGAKDKEGTVELQVDLNMKASSEPTDIDHVQGSGDTSSKNSFSSESSHEKQKVRRTGFKPYKPCSVEAKESRATAGDETRNKRIRLEGETSI